MSKGCAQLTPAFHAVCGGIARYDVLLQLPFGGRSVVGCGCNRTVCSEYVVGSYLGNGASALNEPICISVVCVGFSTSYPALPTAFLHGSAPACVFCLYCNRIFLQDSIKIAIFGEKSKCGKFLKYRRNIHSNRVCLNNVFYYIYVF